MNEISSTLLGYIPVLLPHITERKVLIGEFEKGLNELISLINRTEIKFKNNYTTPLKSIMAKNIEDFPVYKELWEGPPSPFYDFWFIEISSTFIFTEAEVENYVGDFFNNPISVKTDLYKCIAAEEIVKTANDLLLAISIAKNGLIRTSKGVVVYDKTLMRHRIIGTHNLFHEAKQLSDELGWPQIEYLELEKVWNWLNSYGFFKHGVGEGPIGRAIAALTHLIKDEFGEASTNINLDMIWILIGLEAIYGEGNVGLKSQLIEKSRAFLGEPQKFKKLFGRSYDLRSRVIHGDVDLPFRYCSYDAYEKYEKLSSNFGEARLMILSLLLSTIQRLILEGKKELSFQYQVKC